MALSIITDKFRIENAKKFIQSMRYRPYPNDFSDTQSVYERNKSSYLEGELDNMYMFIGKTDPWYEDGTDEPVPDVTKELRQESEIWANALAAKKVEPSDIIHVTFRENWASGTEYPYYQSDETNTATFNDPATSNFYVLDENEFRVYKCLFNNYGSVSDEQPTLVGGVGGDSIRTSREPFYTADGYLWKYMYTIDPALAVAFLTDEYMPVRKDVINDNGSTEDNATVDGAIYRIYFPVKSTVADPVSSPSGDGFARVRVEGVDSATDVTVSGLTIDLTNTDNADRIGATIENEDDMVGYQVEHIIDDGTTIEIEIAEIVASQVEDLGGGSRGNLELTVKMLSDVTATQFSQPSSATEKWFISPLVDIRGEGENATALLRVQGESSDFTSTQLQFVPTDPVSPIDDAIDILMNTNGYGYRNIDERNDFDGTLESLVIIRQGLAEIGTGVTAGDQTLEADREIKNLARIVSVTPYGGHSYDNISELYAYTIMIAQTFTGDETGSAVVNNDFRQLALIQNPIGFDDRLADSPIYRQTIRIEFDGNITTIVGDDDEISDNSNADDEPVLFGRVTRVDYLDIDDKTHVYLSSSFGLMTRTAEQVYNINDTHTLYLSYDASAGTTPFTELTISSRITQAGSDGQYQKGLSSDGTEPGLRPLSGDVYYVENRKPIIRAADQSENIKLVIEY